MASPWTELLFLHGHIADPGLARRLVANASTPPSAPRGKRRRPLIATMRHLLHRLIA